MTSSSDAGLWQPLDVVSRATAISPGGFTPAEAPEAGAPPVPSGTGWLPPLRTTAEMSAENVRRAAERDAFARGHDEAARAERARADALCASALQAVEKVAGHLNAIVAEFAQDRERDLQALAVAVARHIVQHELTIDPLRVGELVRRALDLLPLDHNIEVRLNPEDLRTIGPSLGRVSPEGRPVTVQWVADPSVERGGFVAETPHRIVDGRTDVALRALYERFDHE